MTAKHGKNIEICPSQTDIFWMQQALLYADEAAGKGEVPVGAVIIKQGQLLGAAANSPISTNDPTSHAEILALRIAATSLQNYRLPGATVYVTLEPCIMCMGAMIHARIERLVYGASDPKTGAVSSVYSIGTDGLLNHSISITGSILTHQCREILQNFFKKRRLEKSSPAK